MKTIKKTLILCLSIALVLFLNACEKDDPFKDEYEPNNSLTEAIELTLETQINASISKGDHDFYSFTVDNQEIIENALIELGNFSDNLQLVCSIYDDLGNIRVTYEGGEGTGYAIKWPTTGGTYYLEISDKSGDEEGDYTIKVTDLNDNDDNEPNDTFSQSKVISSIPATITGTIVADADANNTLGDFEFFTILVPGNVTINATATPDYPESDLTLNMEIFDENKNSIESETGGEGDVVSIAISNDSQYDAQFYVKLGGLLGSSDNGDYSITFDD